MNMTVNKWILVQMVIIIAISFFLGYKTRSFENDGFTILPEWLANSSIGELAFARSDENGPVTLKDFSDVQKIYEYIQMHFLRTDVTKKKILEGAIIGGIYSLKDRYSRYVPPQDSKEMQEDIKGFYGGIGIQVEAITSDGKGAMVTSVFKTGPAYEAGMMAGDVITKVEDKECADLYLHEIVALIKGPEKTKIKITVYRPSIKDTVELPIERKRVKYPSVFDKKILEGTKDVGYIRLVQFNDESPKDMQEAIDELQKQGMKSLILDLRENTGGSFKPAIDIADMFIGDGPIVYTEDRNGKLNEYDSQDGGKKLGIPLVVLVDAFSASASEILAGAIKDYKVGTIMGTKTFGKGVVQAVIPLPSDNGALVLTTSKYLTPAKKDINEKGIIPDLLAELDLTKTTNPFLKGKYDEAEKLRQEILKIRDELVKYVRDHDYQLDAAKEYITTGKLVEGVMKAEDKAKEEEKKAEDKAKEPVSK